MKSLFSFFPKHNTMHTHTAKLTLQNPHFTPNYLFALSFLGLTLLNLKGGGERDEPTLH
jgi:hypothetical protein